MQLKRVAILTLVVALAVGVSLALTAAEQGKTKTVEGTLVDTKCYLKGGFTNNDHMGVKDCGTKCAKMGIPVSLLTSKGNLLTVAIPAPQLADYVGQTARVTGEVKSGAIVPDKVEVKKGAKWEEVNLNSMM